MIENYKQVTNLTTGETVQVELTAEEQTQRTAKSEAWTRDVLPGLQLEKLRSDRNRLLAETDYLALSDATLTDEMRTYRQALRDLPANTTDPANPVWPVKPGGDS